jgi:hypothetical protein
VPTRPPTRRGRPQVDRWRNAVLDDDTLESSTKLVGVVLARYMDFYDLDDARPTHERIARESGLALRTVKSHMKKLLDSGWVVMTKKGGSGRANVYAGRFVNGAVVAPSPPASMVQPTTVDGAVTAHHHENQGSDRAPPRGGASPSSPGIVSILAKPQENCPLCRGSGVFDGEQCACHYMFDHWLDIVDRPDVSADPTCWQCRGSGWRLVEVDGCPGDIFFCDCVLRTPPRRGCSRCDGAGWYVTQCDSAVNHEWIDDSGRHVAGDHQRHSRPCACHRSQEPHPNRTSEPFAVAQ